jgi:two-component system, response regulator / RNA-binding antiterminator
MRAALTAIRVSPVFSETVAPYLLLDGDLRIVAANPAYVAATSRTREELVGAYIFDAFPDNPADPAADGVTNLQASLERVLRRARRHRMDIQRYDLPGLTPDEDFVQKFWSPVNSPVLDDRGRTVGVLHHVEDVTAVWALVHGSVPPEHEDVGLPADPATGRRMQPTWAPYALALGNLERRNHQMASEIAQLRTALSSRLVIEQAKGIVMMQQRCGPDEAFERMRRTARSARRPLRDVAVQIIATANGSIRPASADEVGESASQD